MKNVKFNSDRFILNLAYRTFTAWLRRNGYYGKYMANLSRQYPQSCSPQGVLRFTISHVTNSQYRTFKDIVLSSFLFDSTPEGYEYWDRVSDEWIEFSRKYASHF